MEKEHRIKVLFSKKHNYLPFLNIDVGAESQCENNKEAYFAELDKLHQWSNEWFAINYPKPKLPEIQKNKIDYEQSGVVIKKSEGEHLATLPQKPTKPLTKEESMIADMNRCTFIEGTGGLLEYRLVVKKSQLLQDAYDAKMKELKSKK